MSRFLVALVVTSVLLGAIIYSQLRVEPEFVSGLLEADEIRLGSRIGGRVAKVLVAEGDQVTTDQVLVQLEPYDLLEKEQTARADLSAREADLRKLSAGYRKEEVGQAKSRFEQLQAKYQLVEAGPRAEEIAAAEHRVDAAQAQQHLAQQEYDRGSNLYQSNAISKSEFDQIDESWRAANANLAVRQNELAILQAGARPLERTQAKESANEARLAWEMMQAGYRGEDVDAAAAAVAAAKASLDAILRQKEELEIRSPCNGSIDALDLQPGDLVAPNAPVMTLLSDQRLWVRAYVPQRYMQIEVGQKLPVTIDALPSERFTGEVTFISNQAEFTPSNVQTSDDRAKQVYRIRVSLPTDDPRLKPGMTANVWLGKPKLPGP